MEKKISEIKPDPNQPRKTFDEDKLKESSETFKTQGTISPIEIDDKNMIVTGELRWRACKLAGIKTIPVKILKKITKEQRLERQLVENFSRQDMRLVDSIDAVKRLIKSPEYKRLYSGHGDKGISKIAKRLGVSPYWLGQNIKFDREAPKELKKAVAEKKMTISQATEIMKLPEQEDREIITKEILEEAEVPEYRKIRERVQKKKREVEKEKELEKLRETLSRKEIKITTDRERLFRMRDEIIETQRGLNRLKSDIRWMGKTKFYLKTPRDRDSFIRFIEGASDGAKRWASELDELREKISIEIIRE